MLFFVFGSCLCCDVVTLCVCFCVCMCAHCVGMYVCLRVCVCVCVCVYVYVWACGRIACGHVRACIVCAAVVWGCWSAPVREWHDKDEVEDLSTLLKYAPALARTPRTFAEQVQLAAAAASASSVFVPTHRISFGVFVLTVGFSVGWSVSVWVS